MGLLHFLLHQLYRKLVEIGNELNNQKEPLHAGELPTNKLWVGLLHESMGQEERASALRLELQSTEVLLRLQGSIVVKSRLRAVSKELLQSWGSKRKLSLKTSNLPQF